MSLAAKLWFQLTRPFKWATRKLFGTPPLLIDPLAEAGKQVTTRLATTVKREEARRMRQIAKGQLTASNGLVVTADTLARAYIQRVA